MTPGLRRMTARVRRTTVGLRERLDRADLVVVGATDRPGDGPGDEAGDEAMLARYLERAAAEPDVWFGGRLTPGLDLDPDTAVASATSLVREHLAPRLSAQPAASSRAAG